MKRIYKNFKIAGIENYEALFAINEMKIGDKLILKSQLINNIHDENENYSISVLLNAGWDIFDVYIQKINRDELDIQVAVFVREKC